MHHCCLHPQHHSPAKGSVKGDGPTKPRDEKHTPARTAVWETHHLLPRKKGQTTLKNVRFTGAVLSTG
jgi:hypothetical protein